LWKKVGELDEKITETEPFKLVKTNMEAAVSIIKELVVGVHEIAHTLRPIMPQTAQAILEAIAQNKKPENLFVRLEL
jgi:methionyl-tRNA synthetase